MQKFIYKLSKLYVDSISEDGIIGIETLNLTRHITTRIILRKTSVTVAQYMNQTGSNYLPRQWRNRIFFGRHQLRVSPLRHPAPDSQDEKCACWKN